MAYTNFQNCTASEYKNIVYNQETHNKIRILFNNVDYFNDDADEYCESFEVVSRVIPNGSKIFMLENLVSQEATLVLHNIDTSIIQDQVSISIGTLVSENTYEYVPIGIYNLQEIPTTDNGKTTIKLRDNSVKLDFNYNAKPLIDEHGGTATKIQILQDICSQANITCNVSSFIGSSDLIGIYDNTITGRQYVAYLAGSAGAIPIITRSGALDFKYLNNLSTIEIPIEIVEQYSNAENFKISRVVYEDAIRKYESGNETYDTLFLDSANPYISSQEQVASIYNIVNNFEINSFKTGKILGNPAIDSYDLIQITDYDGTIFKTFANNTLRYNGKLINTFASEISFERKKENVSLKSGATFKKWAKTEIDNANAQIIIQAGQIDEIEQDIQNPTARASGTYIDIDNALDEPLIDFKMYGDTQQDSTTGKNKFDKSNIVSITNGTLSNDIITSRAISSDYDGVSASISSLTLQAGTYYVSMKVQLASGTVRNNLNSITILASSTTTKAMITNPNLTNQYQIYSLSLVCESETSISSIGVQLKNQNTNAVLNITDIMISTSNNTDFEPYTNGPAPNPSYPFNIHNVSGDNTIEICGKNLIRNDLESVKSYNTSGTWEENVYTYSGMTFTYNDDKSITISGTNSETRTRYFYINNGLNMQTLVAGTYTRITYKKNQTLNSDVSLQTRKDSVAGTDIFGSGAVNVRNATLSENTNIVIRLAISGSATTNITVYPMIVKGTYSVDTIPEYEPYTGNSQLISLGVENLFDKDNATYKNNYYKNENGVETSSSASGYTTSYIAVKPNTTYTINGSLKATTNTSAIYFYDNSKNWISRVSNSVRDNTGLFTFTTPNNCYYIQFQYIMAVYDDTTIQIEKGSKANSYSPYGANYIELNKIDTYQDYIYKDNDRWFLHKEIGKVVLTGASAEDWHYLSGGRFYSYIIQTYALPPSSDSEVAQLLSNYAKVVTRNNLSNVATGIAMQSDGTLHIKVDANYTTKSELTTWLSTHNTIVYYVLATSTDTEITDTTLIEQLNRLMTLPLYKNMTHITLTPNDLQPTMKIEYYRDTSLNNTFVPKTEMNKYYTKTETNAQILINSSSIQQSVSELQETTNGNTGAITSLSNQVNTLQTSTSLQINAINEQLEDGVSKVKTTTGYTLDGNGLSITKGQGFSSLTTDRYQKIEYNNKELSFMGYDDTLNKPISRIEELEARKITTGVHRTETIQEDGEKWTAQYYVGGGN